MTKRDNSSSVREARQGEETESRWDWVERAAWSDRMLDALERGLKGGKWFSLIDKVVSDRNLRAAWARVRSNRGAAGIDRQGVGQFAKNEEYELNRLRSELMEHRYRPHPVLRRHIPKPGTKKTRPLGIPTVRDRVVQQAVRQVIEPIFENQFIETSFGFRPRRGSKDALRRVQALLDSGHTWVVDADIESYFDTIEHGLLMNEVRRHVADGKVLDLLTSFLNQEVFESCQQWKPTLGTPQGAVISPLLANIYLHPVDVRLQQAGFEVVRYADDLVVMCRTESRAQQALSLLRECMDDRGLKLHPEKTKLVDATAKGGFDFLGYHFERGLRWPRDKSRMALKDRLRPMTRRTSGRSLAVIIADINPVLKGWYAYFKHGQKNVLADLDGWVRMRLRSILRRRHGGQGRGRGSDHYRWPNAYFHELGLFCMTKSRDLAVRSRKG